MPTRTVKLKPGQWLNDALGRALGQLLEPGCRLCLEPTRGARDLCERCCNALPWHPGGCPQCADLRTPGRYCGACFSHPPAFQRVAAAFRYDAEVATLIRRFKHRGDLSAGRLLADQLTSRLPKDLPETLVPVPLDEERFRQRGFNQANEIARRLPGRVRPALAQRTGQRPPQRGLAANQRRRNIRGAFAMRTEQLPERVTLVDDVVTTGATARELAHQFARAGVTEITVCALARA